MQFKTLSRQDPEFDAYLRGTFSKTERALPVRSLNVDTAAETVTFQIVPVNEISRPSFLSFWAQVFRVRNFVYVLFPLFLIVMKNVFDDVPWDPNLAWLSTLGALFLSLGAFLQNDYLDHFKGVDRVHPLSGSRAIQKGWVTADSLLKWSWFHLVLGALFGLPAIWVFPELLWILLPVAIMALALILFPKMGLKYRRGAEFMVFLLFGPVLTVGFQIAITGLFDLEALWIGLIAGWHYTFLVHVKNFESILVNSQGGFTNTVSYLGFEKGRKFLELCWLAFLVALAIYQWTYHGPIWSVIFSILPAVFSIPFLLNLRRLKSPVGSHLSITVRLARTAGLLTLMLWSLQCFWYWLVIEIGNKT